MKARWLLALLLGSIIVACCSCESSQSFGKKADDGLYTRYNLHFISEKGMNKASYANWTEWPGHDMLPYNSKIRLEGLGSRIHIKDVNTNRRIVMEFHSGRMAMSAREYVNLITSPTPVSYEGLSDVDQQGIQAGKAIAGMSKQGVMIALGYPAKHRTPSTDGNVWVYWKGRHDSYAVEFDDSGKVAAIRN